MSYSISITTLGNNPTEFIESWSAAYAYGGEEKYAVNIGLALNSWEPFFKMFEWKNGTGEKIAESKMLLVKSFWDQVDVLKGLERKMDWGTYESTFRPGENAVVWKTFLLHLIDPEQYPIFDQHVYRCQHFLTHGKIREIPTYPKTAYAYFKDQYLPWFNKIRSKVGSSTKKMDEAFFAYGKMLKGLKPYPYHITP
ncbi:MAG: hypothetical protein ACFHWX_07795 [Bacteroidota bacterium]